MRTCKEVLDRLDVLLPNGYDRQQKLDWLREAEGFVVQEVTGQLTGGEEAQLPDPWTEDTLLTVPVPYDGLYLRYLERCIHYADGETERCNNASAAWNNALLTYRDAMFRTHMPRRAVSALRLC